MFSGYDFGMYHNSSLSPDDLASSGLNENTSQGEANLPRDAKVLHEEAIKASNEAALKKLVENYLTSIDEVLKEEASTYQQWYDCANPTGHDDYLYRVGVCGSSEQYYEKVLALQQFLEWNSPPNDCPKCLEYHLCVKKVLRDAANLYEANIKGTGTPLPGRGDPDYLDYYDKLIAFWDDIRSYKSSRDYNVYEVERMRRKLRFDYPSD